MCKVRCTSKITISKADKLFSELSEELNVSENRLILSFKKEVAPHQMPTLQKFGCRTPPILLINGSMSVSDVSNAVGIGDSNYFVKLFKKEFGETPTVIQETAYELTPN